jgi:AraC-like DNA-binding protein
LRERIALKQEIGVDLNHRHRAERRCCLGDRISGREAKMALSEVRSFDEPSEFAAAIHLAEVELCLLARGPFNADITRTDLNSLKIGRFAENQARIMHSAISDDRARFAFRTGPGADLFRSGIELAPNSIARLAQCQMYFQRSTGPVSWGNMSLPVDEIHLAGIVGAGCDLTPPPAETIFATTPAAMAKLQRLHAAAGLLAETAPEVLDQPEPRHALEKALVEALVGCFSTRDGIEDRSTQRQHKKIMQRFHAILHAATDRPLYVLEIARMIGVSERSLSACCQEYLGMGPKKYLLLRRLHLARRTLLAADPQATTVTDVATQFGFWQLGRFSIEYKFLFGESPSITLNRNCP